MSIINNMPNKSGSDINGLIEDYYVYAGQTINAGDFVNFVNGVASQATETSSSVQLSGSYDGYKISAVVLDENRVFIAHSYGSSYSLYAMVVTISGTTITKGTDTALNTNGYNGYYVSATCLQNGSVLVLHSKTSSGSLNGIVCTIDGTTIAKGTDQELTTKSNSSVAMSTEVLENGDVFLAHCYNNSNYLYGVIIKVSGTSITYGTETSINGNSSSGLTISISLLNNNKIFVAHSYNSTYYYLYGIIITINGTTITKGTDTQLSTNSYTGQKISIQTLENGNVFIAHSYSDTLWLYGIVCTINDTTIIKGTDTCLDSSAKNDAIADVKSVLYKGKVFIPHGAVSSNSQSLYGVFCTINGTTITAGSDIALNSSAKTGTVISPLLLFNDTIFIAHSYGGSYYLYAQIFGIDEVNNVPTNNVPIPVYEQQITLATQPPFNGIAKTDGVGGTAIAHKDIISIYVPNI